MTRLLLALFAAALAAPAQKPNFVVILADDLGYGDLGAYGSTTIRTPRLDRLAREGVRFTDFYAAAPFCSPSRAAILTGRYPVRAGVPYVLFPTEKNGLPPWEVTLAEMLKPAGYATAAIGKWHLGWPKELRAQRQGFDFFYGLPYSNDMFKLGPGEEFRAQHARWELPLMHDDEVLEAPPDQHTLTRRYTERALDFIRTNRDRPFLLYLPHTFPHTPVYASEDFEGRSPHGLYADSVEEIDWSTGQIVDLLADLGIAERTLVIFTSDNGSHMARPGPSSRFGQRGGGGGNGPLQGRKGNNYDGGVRVPGIFRMPGTVEAGRTESAVASILDILPTVAEMAGVEPPAGRTIDGRSLAGLLTGREAAPAERPHFYYFGAQLQAVRLGKWKLWLSIGEYPKDPPSLWYELQPNLVRMHHPLRPAPALYDLAPDVAEANDVAAANPDVVARLSGVAREFDAAMQRDKTPASR